MVVIKRDGREAKFDRDKIYTAIKKAFDEVSKSKTVGNGAEIAERITERLCSRYEKGNQTLQVEDIQDDVETELMEEHEFDVAKAYIRYRHEHELMRNGNLIDGKILSLVDGVNESIIQENSNKNPMILSTQRDYIAGEVSRDITNRLLLPDDVRIANDEGLIHFHDADYFVEHEGNCCLVNLEDMLQNGTVISGTMIEKPHSFSTACNIATQIIAQVASCQYGGQSITLSHLAPFVDVSRQAIRKNVEEEVDAVSRESGELSAEERESLVHDLTEKRVRDEVRKGVQTIQYQVVTLMTTNGQAPFITVFMYLNEVEDGQLKDDLAMIIEEVVKQRYEGVKNEKGVWITPAFPKLVYVLEEDNITEDSKYWYLTKLCAQCSAKRLVPDYISEKIMLENKIDKNGEGHCYPCMGCVDGDEVVTYMLHGTIYVESIERMWNRLSDYYDINTQPNGTDLYMDTDEVEIYDQKNGFVKNLRLIRNSSTKWVKVEFENGYSLLCTIDHPFETENRGVVLAKDLTENDLIASVKSIPTFVSNDCHSSINQDQTLIHPTSITPVEREAYSYDVTTESNHFTVSGLWSHNCRSFLTPYVDPETGKPKYYGRFNQGVVTINLPDVGLSAHAQALEEMPEGEENENFHARQEEIFWQIFDERLELCHKALRIRHERLLGTVSDASPIHWQYGALARLKKGETIDKLLYGGYSTLSLGYAGLYECVKAMTGKSHTDEGAKPFALAVMQYMNDKCKKWKAEENIDYSLYGTPIESTTYKFAKSLQKRFGVIPGITDKNYVTNSYHVHVTEPINAFDKLKFEAEFQLLSPGGAISYIETSNLSDNIDAVLAVLQYIYDHIMYAELNTKSDYCQVCGYDGEIKIVETEDGKLVWECPNCGNRDKSKMNIARRTCGYIGTNDWNQGRTQEIKDRYVHLGGDEDQGTTA